MPCRSAALVMGEFGSVRTAIVLAPASYPSLTTRSVVPAGSFCFWPFFWVGSAKVVPAAEKKLV